MKSSNKQGQLILGVDLGGSKISAIAADAKANIKARDDRDTCAEQGPEEVIARVIQSIKQVMASPRVTSPADIVGIGIGAAGVCEAASGVITAAPNLPGWVNVPLRDIIQREFGFPIYLDNDTNVAALGEHCFGAGVGIDNLIYVGLGTGIGGGIIVNGQLYHGISGAAGEIGHMIIDVQGPRCNCGNIGCWEAFASGTALTAAAVREIEAGAQTTILSFADGDLNKVSAETVFLAAEQGDRLASDLIRLTGYYLGVGLVNLVHIFNPELILIGGGVSQMGKLLLVPAAEVVKERAFELPARAVRIELARLGTDAGVLGAVALVLEKMSRPSS